MRRGVSCLVFGLFAGCVFAPSFEEGALTCGVGCPDGMACAADGFCYRDAPDALCIQPARPAQCTVPVTHDSVQAALDDAACSTVRVRSGTYNETLSIGRPVSIWGHCATLDGGQRGSTIRVDGGTAEILGLTVTGGLAEHGGGIYALSPIILRDVSVVRNRAEGAVVRGAGLFAAASLEVEDSLFAENTASAETEEEDAQALGGAVYITGVPAVFSNTEFRENVAVAASDNYLSKARGGAVDAVSSASVTFQDSTFAGNVARAVGIRPRASGGAVYLNRAGAVLERCEVIGNSAYAEHPSAAIADNVYAQGGGVMAELSRMDLIDSSVTGNETTAGLASDGHVRGNVMGRAVDMQILRTRIAGNTLSAVSGGSPGVAVYGGGLSLVQNEPQTLGVEMDGLELVDNEARLAGTGVVHGGGASIRVAGDASRVTWDATRSLFARNTARGEVADGEATRVEGGGLYFEARAGVGAPELEVSLSQSGIIGNRAHTVVGPSEAEAVVSGGGLHVESTSTLDLSLVNVTISGNQAADDGGDASGGGVSLVHAGGLTPLSAQMGNVTIYNNQALRAGGLFAESAVTLAAAASIISGNTAAVASNCALDGATTAISNSVVGEVACDPGRGNIVAADPGLGPLSPGPGLAPTHPLKPESPALNAEGACLDPAGASVMVDQHGMPRGIDSCDLGAHHNQP